MPYLHELPSWPAFRWDDGKLLPLLAQVRHQQGRLLGRMECLGFSLQALGVLMPAEPGGRSTSYHLVP